MTPDELVYLRDSLNLGQHYFEEPPGRIEQKLKEDKDDRRI